jgi:polysaccharide export outer membrane protein
MPVRKLRWKDVAVALALLPVAMALHAQQSGPALQTRQSGLAVESLLIGRGDMLHVRVLREPDLEQMVRVRDSGDVTVALIGTVHVGGLSTAEAAAAISDIYLKENFLKHPNVSVAIEELATQPVSVLGEVAKPGTFSLTTPLSLMDVLAMAGGLTQYADRHITIERADAVHSRETVFVSNDAVVALNADVQVSPGDKIIVPKAGIVYVLGDVGHPGGYMMQNNSRMTVLEAVALAAGTNHTASERRVRLIRTDGDRYEEHDLALKAMEEGKAPDRLLRANDVLYIPFSFGKNITMGTSSILAATTSALIYAGH